MPKPSELLYKLTIVFRGYFPSQALIGGEIIPAYFGGTSLSLIDGNDSWVRNGRIFGSLGPGAIAPNVGAQVPVLVNVGNSFGGLTTSGNVVTYFNLFIFAGVGDCYVAGTGKIGTVAAGQSLVSPGNSLMEVPMAGPFNAVPVGVLPPTTGPIIADAGVAGKNNGSYSVLLTAIRKPTGEESNRSPISTVVGGGNVVVVQNHAISITQFPTIPSGATHWGIYCSRTGFGNDGPWFHLVDIPITVGAPYVITLPNDTPGWFDGDLGSLAPITNNVPPACSFVFTLNNIIVAAQAWGPNGLQPSTPGSVGSYPPGYAAFLPDGGAITACKGTGFEGACLVSTANSLYLIRATNDPTTPISIIQLWPHTGFASANNFCTFMDEIYGFVAGQGVVTSHGAIAPGVFGEVGAKPFGSEVSTKFTDLGFTADANTVVVHDPFVNSILFAHGTHCFPFDLKYAHWQPDQTIAAVVSGITDNQIGKLEAAGGIMSALEHGGGVNGTAVPAFTFGHENFAGFPKTLARFWASGSGPLNFDVLTNEDLATIAGSFVAVPTFGSSQTILHPNIKQARSFTARVKFTGANPPPYLNAINWGYHPHMVGV